MGFPVHNRHQNTNNHREVVRTMITQEQYEDAVRKVIERCKLLRDMKDYTGYSVRNILQQLSYQPEDQDAILKLIAEGGFDYCLDPIVVSEWYDSNKQQMVKESPSWQGCIWGDPMQIASRLYGLRNCPNARLYNLR